MNGAIKTPRQRIQEEAWDRVGETVFSFGHELIVRHPIKRCASRGRWCIHRCVCERSSDNVIQSVETEDNISQAESKEIPEFKHR